MLAQAIRDEIRPDYTMDQPVERYTAPIMRSGAGSSSARPRRCRAAPATSSSTGWQASASPRRASPASSA